MEEKIEKQEVELTAITKDYVVKQLKDLLDDPMKKAILDEYFVLINSLNTPVKLTSTAKEDSTTEIVDSKTNNKSTK